MTVISGFPPRWLWPEDVELAHEVLLELGERFGAKLHHRDIMGIALRPDGGRPEIGPGGRSDRRAGARSGYASIAGKPNADRPRRYEIAGIVWRRVAEIP